MILGLGPEVLNAAKAIGLIDAGGNLRPAWFERPVQYLNQMLSSPEQRTALLDIFDQLFPPAEIAGSLPGEKWHPLLGAQPRGNLYFTVRDDSGHITLGAAGDIGVEPGTTLRVKLPLVSLNGGARTVAGSADGPLTVELRVPLASGGAVPLKAVRATSSVSVLPVPSEKVQVVLESLDLDGTGPRNVALDPDHLDRPALNLVLDLLRLKLDEVLAAGSASDEAKSTASHLLQLLGIGDGIPLFPFAEVDKGPGPLRQWLRSLIDSGKIQAALQHLAGLLGSSNPVTLTPPTWTVRILDLDANGSALDLTLTHDIDSSVPALKVGFTARFRPPGGATRIDVSVTLVSIPLAGMAPTRVLSDASILMIAPGAAGSLAPGSFGLLSAGARWTGTDLVPALELHDATVLGTHYDKIDLTNTDSVVSAAKDLVGGAITAALGSTGAGAHLAALAGLRKPAGDPGAPNSVALAALAANPSSAIAAFHRKVLLDTTHNWGFMLSEAAGLLGVGGAVTGTGTFEDPWRVALAASGPVSVELVAWNAQSSGNGADPQMLRIGLRATASMAPWQSTWTTELLAFDLPATGAGTAALMASQHARILLKPVPAAIPLAGVAASADSVSLAMDWTPGGPMRARAGITNAKVEFAGSTIAIPALQFPAPAGFDINNPGVAFGISNADFHVLLRGLLARGLSDWAGPPGSIVASLTGLGPAWPGLPLDFPALSGAFITDPLPALRAWLAHLAQDLSTSGQPFLPQALSALQSLLAGTAPQLPIPGSGTYDDPWVILTLPHVDMLAWLEPVGPPASWAALAANRINAASKFPQLIKGAEGTALTRLADYFQHSDGVVPIESQVPSGPNWTAGAQLTCAHPLQPKDPLAIAQIRAQINTWNPIARAVLLIGPAFSDHTIWTDLLAPEASKPNFDLRVPGSDPLAIDLTSVTSVANYYTADVRDDGTNNLDNLAAQIGRLVDRIRTLRGNLPVTLVAHSTAGVAARAYTAANPAKLNGLITLGTPHTGADLPPLTNSDVADGVRTLQSLELALPAGPVKDALDHILAAMDGYRPPLAPDQLPLAAPYPVGSFAGGSSIDAAGVPALAIGSVLAGSLFVQVKQSLAAKATAAAVAASTHLSFAIRTRLIADAVFVRADAFRIALSDGAPEPARPAHALTVLINLDRPGNWLVGDALSDVRVRRAQVGAFVVPGHVTPIVRLYQAAFHSPASNLVEFGAPQIQPLLGRVLQGLQPGSPVLNALKAIGLAVPDSRIGLSADAFSAISSDALSFLGPRVQAALNAPDGLLGLPGDPVYITADTIGVRATAIPLGAGASLTFDAGFQLGSFQPGLDLSLTLGSATLAYSQKAGTLKLSAPPWLTSLTIFPKPTPVALATVLNQAIPRVLLSSLFSALLEAASGAGVHITAIDCLLADPGGTLASALDGPRITQLLQAIAKALGQPPGPGLALPGGLQITAAGTNPVAIQFATLAPVGGTLSLNLGVSIDQLRHVSPSGTLSLHVTLPGTWTGVTLAFGTGASGLTLDITPASSGSAIQIVPTFSGLGVLAAGGQALLPAALDALNGTLPASPVKTSALNLAQALDLFDGAGGFGAHAAQWKALSLRTLSAGTQTAAATAATALFKSVLPSANVSGNKVRLPVASFDATVGWDGSGPTFQFTIPALKLSAGGITADVNAGYASGALLFSTTLGFHLQSSAGIAVVPQLVLGFTGSQLSVRFLPLGVGSESVLSINLAPVPGLQASGDAPLQFAQKWLLPVVADLLVSAEKANLGKTLWAGGPTVKSILTASGILTGAGVVAAPLPGVQSMVFSALQAIGAGGANINAGDLTLRTYGNALGFAITLKGTVDIGGGQFKVLFGDDAFPYTPGGLSLQLFDGSKSFKPTVGITGLGVSFSGEGDSPLVNTSAFRLGAAAGYLFATIDLTPSLHVSNFGGGVKLGSMGLPLTQLGGANDGGNPVAASLLHSDGGSNTGDKHPVNPGIDVRAWVRGSDGDILFQNSRDPVWIGVHSSFGPIYIDKVGIAVVNNRTAADLLVDGTVKLAGFELQTEELGLTIPFHSVLTPKDWSLDLRGLALSFQGSGISIAGGLLKNSGANGIEYDGVLMVDLAGRGFSIIGGYARPSDALGNYTSLFLFVSLPIPLGGPPFFFVTGLGGGGGYNRELNVPQDVSQLASFPLIAAMDDDSLANDPMSALSKMATQIPSRRGSYWFAAGVRFNSFVVVNSIAMVYVALDRGFDIGILGLSRMQLPAPGIALASVELAIKVRFSTAEGVLSVQAQLTDNSYLFSHDCQLTGGFAFFIWFRTGKFVLTLGGYHPAFPKPPEFPDVPRLGFHWSVADFITIKGGAYFALTSSAVMAGGSLEASASIAGIRAWFLAYADLLISWDPFHYDVQIGVQVGISVRIHVCFFGCVTIELTISRGASVHIIGPPLHGEVSVDAYITTITIPFGPHPNDKPPYIPWDKFAAKYLIAGDPHDTCVGMHISDGLLAAEPPGAQPTAGTQGDPWRLRPEFAFSTETRMPASGYVIDLGAGMGGQSDQRLYDLAPMHQIQVGSVFKITITPAVAHPVQFKFQAVFSNVPEATWRWSDPDHQAAAANVISAMTGLDCTAIAILLGKSALIPISTLVDDDPAFALPLPFATVLSAVGVFKAFGASADLLALAVAPASTNKTLAGAAKLLAGNGIFAEARKTVGLPERGLSPIALGALKHSRSAPPVLTPITTGLSMKPVGLATPPSFFRVPERQPVPLTSPRLHTVLQTLPLAVNDVPPATRTTVATVAGAKSAVRMKPPHLQVVPGARLERVAPATAPRPTLASLGSRSLRNPELAALTGTAHAQVFADAAKLVLGDGLPLPAGTTHLWELSGTGNATVVCTGEAAIRITAFNRGMQVIDDRELVTQDQASLPLPPKTTAVAVTCLGHLEIGVPTGFGTASLAAAPPGGVPVSGWQSGSLVAQTGPNTLLGRGAVIKLPVASRLTRNGQPTSYAMTRVSAAVVNQPGVETWLPLEVQTLMILLDQQDPTAAFTGDLALSVRGAKLLGEAILVQGGTRSALLYEVSNADPTAARLAVAVGSKAGWRLSGIIGLRGRAVEQAVRMHGNVPPQIVPDGPLTPDGQTTVSLRLSL